MRSQLTSQIALAAQLFAASAGLYAFAAPAAGAQDQLAAQDGAVTLTGTVKSDDEKKTVEDKAAEIAGAGKVTDNLTVAQN